MLFVDKRKSSNEDDQLSLASLSPQQRTTDDKVVDYLTSAEKMCNILRSRILVQPKNVKEALQSSSLLLQANNLQTDVCGGSFLTPFQQFGGFQMYTVFQELYPASMIDIQKWNVREVSFLL